MTESPHLLLVEDDEQISTLIDQFFRVHAKSYRMRVARNAKDMDQILAASGIDLILLDEAETER